MEDMFYYSENGGVFRSRQHVINHVDMILGLTKSEQEMDDQRKLIVIFDREKKEYIPIMTTDIKDGDFGRFRNRIILDSFYASEWLQFSLAEKEDGDLILSKDLQNEEALEELLNLAFDVWVEKEQSWENFIDRTAVVAIMLNWEVPVVDRIVVNRIPTEEEIEGLPVALNTRNTISKNYVESVAWKAFSEKICKNVFVKQYLSIKQNEVCAVCKRSMNNNTVIHHVDYDWNCSFCNSKLEWRIPNTRTQPNCELCFNEHREWFDACVSRLKLLHNSCHYYIDHL